MYKKAACVLLFLSLNNCTFTEQSELSLYSEDNTYFSKTETTHVRKYIPTGQSAIQHVSEQLAWLAPEKAWHYNCLFLKPIRELNSYEMQMAIPFVNTVSLAHWEIRNKAYDSAGKLLRESADEGFPLANVKLAKMLAEGLGVQANPKGAHQLLSRAASSNCAMAQYELAKLVSTHFKDNLTAWGWAKKAAEQGHVKAKALQKALGKSMNPLHFQLAESYIQASQKYYMHANWKDSFRPVECVYTKARRATAFISTSARCRNLKGYAKPLKPQKPSPYDHRPNN